MIPIVLGTHEYEWALHPFAELFAKYFGDEKVIYFGDKIEKKIPDNVVFQRVIAFPDGEWDWWTCFGEGLKSICYFHTGKIILLFLLDHWLNQPVDRKIIDSLTEYMVCHPNVFRANLTEDFSWHTSEVEQVEKWQGLDIVEIKPWSIHASYNGGISFSPALWRPELLGRAIQSHWGFHDCENKGSEYIKQQYPKIKAISSHPLALYRTHGLFHAQPKKVSLAGLSEDDRQIVMKSLPNDFTHIS